MDRPLSWKQARSQLRRVLEEYVASSHPNQVNGRSKRHVGSAGAEEDKTITVSWWIRNDLDLYVGSFVSSLLLLLVASFSFVSRTNYNGFGSSILNTSAEVKCYSSSLIASVLLVCGALISIWILRRRRYSCLKDSDTGKRREILRFLNAMRREEEEALKMAMEDNNGHAVDDGQDKNDDDSSAQDFLQLNGNSLTDIYPVYRLLEKRLTTTKITRSSKVKSNVVGSWTRIPSLLLVKGDYIALQVGDISPGKCCKVVDDNCALSSFEIEAGERITLASIGETADDVTMALPRGRSSLPSDSPELLTLCNRMRIFVLQETPLEEFLRRPQGPPTVPMIVRQIQTVRSALSVMALPLFAAITVILFARPDITSGDLSMVLSLPLLAMLGLFPVVGPALIILLEILGTARILMAVHAHAKGHHESAATSSNRPRSANFHLLMRYIVATSLSRLSLWDRAKSAKRFFGCFLRRAQNALEQGASSSNYLAPQLVRVPPASVHLLEKLGVATAFALVDDELACEPHAMPQQLLIPSERGLNLLRICPTYDDDSEVQSEEEKLRSNEHDSDSDSDDMSQGQNNRKGMDVFRRRRKRKWNGSQSEFSDFTEEHTEHEVQFEDPLWWHHLPALKCIGLGCLLVGETDKVEDHALLEQASCFCSVGEFDGEVSPSKQDLKDAKSALVKLVCAERRSNQLRSLAQCIGFSTERNSFGSRGDLSPFTERLRLHVISNMLLRERLEIDPHERGSEESRWWGLLHPDATSVVVRDRRSQAYQLLTVGDPIVVTSLCYEAWQGENSTILPLAAADRATILNTSESWKLANLDATAFSYAPVPWTLDRKLGRDENEETKRYLLTQSSRAEQMHPTLKDKTMPEDWSLINNQIFLGVLGSLVVPRKEIRDLLSTLSDAGVRFVYFSPRNMRRQKELASQMGIDVAWNCAISLRPLESGEDDPHRMVSNYADWDVNAKLPHGIENVKKHLREVDNVPLLVSLFTDVTKQTTMEMVETFQEYHDTVIAVGLSHLPRNSFIFSAADIAVGVDMLQNTTEIPETAKKLCYNNVLPSEVTFISAISAHSCAFRLRGPASASHIPNIISQGRASLEAATSAAIFFVASCLSFSLSVLFSACTTSTTVPYIPTLGAVVYFQILLPGITLTMAMSDPDSDSMNRVPPKNDQMVTFGRSEGRRLYGITFLKAIPPAVLPQLLYLIAYGALLIEFEPDFIREFCSPDIKKGDWVSVIRCVELRKYSGPARTSSGTLMLAELLLCTIVASAAFVHRTIPILELPPWRGNRAWAYSVLFGLLIVTALLLLLLEDRSIKALPWYYFVLAVIMPFVCLVWNETWKRVESKHLRRAEKLRRLQFETRLGMWSPK